MASLQSTDANMMIAEPQNRQLSLYKE